ncbi:nascent polypeptide-associated complex subunit alpha, muscle-specific form-like isoform X1 [Gallus gallus]|uniref:nascent polypeptide-associated complex subunit alpha, muscle-specific form-like isoform X1 n=1 Tax=Gallus gallus TaxID=9031 RepID=UPI001F007137|nr:nascent polypeptide-associated complex subunit alpha, muscle-specific form-like isoform X1 [Gallus gallus]
MILYAVGNQAPCGLPRCCSCSAPASVADSWQSRGSQGCCHSTKTEGHILGCATEPASFHRSPQGFPKNKSAPRATAAPRAAAVQEDRIQAAQCRNTAGVLPERTCGKWKGRGARTQTCLLQGLRKSAGRALPPPRSSPVPGRVEPGDAPGVVQAEPALSSPNAAAAPPDHKPSAGCHGPRPRALPLRRSGGQRCRAAEPRLPERGGNESGHARGLRGRSCRRAATPSKWLRHRRGPSPAGPPVPPPTRRARRTAPVAPRSTARSLSFC